VVEDHRFLAFLVEGYPDPRVEVGQVSQALDYDVAGDTRSPEYLLVRKPGDLGTGLFGLADDLDSVTGSPRSNL